VPDWLGGLTNLINLDLVDNQLKRWPVELAWLSEEGMVITDEGVFSDIDPNENMKWLDYFDASGDDADLLQAWRAECVLLWNLWDESKPVTAWPGISFGEPDSAKAGQVVKICVLNVSRVKTRWGRGDYTMLGPTNTLPLTLPVYLGRLGGLVSLSLCEHNLTSLPKELGELMSLEHLSLTKNYLTALPAELGKLSSLKVLNLSCNILESVPVELAGLSALEELHLDRNKLTSVPNEFGGLNSLRVLRLSGNKLKCVPAELGGLTKLETLALDDNMLTSVPVEFGGLSSLKALMLNDNMLTSVPEELGMLTALKLLNLLENNPLRSLPAAIHAWLRVTRVRDRYGTWWERDYVAYRRGSIALW